MTGVARGDHQFDLQLLGPVGKSHLRSGPRDPRVQLHRGGGMINFLPIKNFLKNMVDFQLHRMRESAESFAVDSSEFPLLQPLSPKAVSPTESVFFLLGASHESPYTLGPLCGAFSWNQVRQTAQILPYFDGAVGNAPTVVGQHTQLER